MAKMLPAADNNIFSHPQGSHDSGKCGEVRAVGGGAGGAARRRHGGEDPGGGGAGGLQLVQGYVLVVATTPTLEHKARKELRSPTHACFKSTVTLFATSFCMSMKLRCAKPGSINSSVSSNSFRGVRSKKFLTTAFTRRQNSFVSSGARLTDGEANSLNLA